MTASEFLQAYEAATNSHDFAQVEPLIAADALYYFSDETLKGIAEIKWAFTRTWSDIKAEAYSITNVNWLVSTDDVAACVYNFHWTGLVDGAPKEGRGRGTNVLQNQAGIWKMIHEHLSKEPTV